MALSVEGKVKCFVCDNEKHKSRLGTTFICPSCICKGDFTSSKGDAGGFGSSSMVKEKFSDKRVKLGNLEGEHREINERLSKLLEESKQLEAIEQTIADYEVKIGAMQKMINEKKQEQVRSEEYSRKLAKTEKILKSHQEKFKSDIEETHKTIDQVSARMRIADQERERLLKEIKIFTKESISQLKEFIFPFQVANNRTMIGGPMESCSAESDQQTEEESCDASESFSTTCCQPSMESWVNVEPNNQRYNIVEAWIPRDSISRAYCHWSSQMKEHLTKISPVDGEVVKTRDNDAYRLSAALAYITQLLTVASYYMDTRFPKKLNFVEFYTKYSGAGSEALLFDEELLHKVAKLNTNLIYLCLSQNVHPSLLEPTVTGKNLSLLLNPSYSDLGRIGPVYIDSETHRKVEEALYPDYSLIVDQLDNQEAPQNESYDESEFMEDGWESVQPSTPYMDLYNSQQTTSISNGIMSSIADAVTSLIRKK